MPGNLKAGTMCPFGNMLWNLQASTMCPFLYMLGGLNTLSWYHVFGLYSYVALTGVTVLGHLCMHPDKTKNVQGRNQ